MALAAGSVMHRTGQRWALGLLTLAGLLTGASTSEAAFNDMSCKSAPGAPPVLLVHGQGGSVNGMGAIIAALSDRCVFGIDYGREAGGGLNGRAGLNASADAVSAYLRRVLEATKESQVDLVGHSAGVGVIDNIILRGQSPRVRNVVSFGGLHHPYAHLGVANLIDATVFLPALTQAVRASAPPFTRDLELPDLAASALGFASSLGAPIPPDARALVGSGFVADLFSPTYWFALHGGLSEPDHSFLSAGASQRSLRTRDSDASVCYTNIVGVADFITGASAGFQDSAPNVENFVLTSYADHVGMLTDPIALAKMREGVTKRCAP